MDLDWLSDNTLFSESVRDPVWKDIRLTPALRDITRSSRFLRLYGIRQLGPTEYVYPGATHTRASHSLGVYHLALRMLRVLLSGGASSWVTKAGCWSFLTAALLHDLGHFPFTHSLKELPLRDHESLTAEAVRSQPLADLCRAAGADPDVCSAIIDDSLPCPPGSGDEVLFFRKLLSGVLDPDKLDYLNRDAFFCGVPYGIQDTDFVLSQIHPDRERGIVLDSRAIMSVEGVLFSKYLMYRSVYWHRQVRIATAMMKKAIYAALTGNFIGPERLYNLDDEGIYALISSLDLPERSLASSIRRRDFYRVCAEMPFNAKDDAMTALEDIALRREAEGRVASLVSTLTGRSVPPHMVIIDVPERVSFESDLLILDEGKPFSESSTVFSGGVVERFASSLRKVRVAVEPSLAVILEDRPSIAEELAKCIGLRYTQG